MLAGGSAAGLLFGRVYSSDSRIVISPLISAFVAGVIDVLVSMDFLLYYTFVQRLYYYNYAVLIATSF